MKINNERKAASYLNYFNVNLFSHDNSYTIDHTSIYLSLFLIVSITLATPGFFGLVIPRGGAHWPPPANFL